MNHVAFVRSIAEEMGVSIAEAKRWHEAFLSTMYFGLARDGEVALKDLGKFSSKRYGAKTETPDGTERKVPAYYRIDFRMSTNLKKVLKGER